MQSGGVLRCSRAPHLAGRRRTPLCRRIPMHQAAAVWQGAASSMMLSAYGTERRRARHGLAQQLRQSPRREAHRRERVLTQPAGMDSCDAARGNQGCSRRPGLPRQRQHQRRTRFACFHQDQQARGALQGLGGVAAAFGKKLLGPFAASVTDAVDPSTDELRLIRGYATSSGAEVPLHMPSVEDAPSDANPRATPGTLQPAFSATC